MGVYQETQGGVKGNTKEWVQQIIVGRKKANIEGKTWYNWAKKEVCPMIKGLDEQKAKLKERLNRETDEYFEALKDSASKGGFDINALEKLMLENQRKLKTTLSEANSELASNVETGVKKLPRVWKIFRKGKK